MDSAKVPEIGDDNPLFASVQHSKFSLQDEFGFERPPGFDAKSHEEFMSSYLSTLVKRSQKWDRLLRGDASYKNVKKNRQIKRFVRKGIPKSHRAKVWMIISGAEKMRQSQPGLYLQMLSPQMKPDSSVIERISEAVGSIFPDNVYFRGQEGDPKNLQQPLFSVLLAFANAKPDIGCNDDLNRVAGMLLIITRDEETSFWLLKVLVEKLLPTELYESGSSAIKTEVKVLAALMSKRDPTLNARVKDWSVFHDWFSSLYTDVLPVETTLRVWDCLFYEGSKILFRVAIALLGSYKKLAVPSVTKEWKRFCLLTPGVVHCHEFVELMFENSVPLSSREINKLRLEVV